MTRSELFKSGNFTTCATCVNQRMQGIVAICKAYSSPGIGQVDWLNGSANRLLFKPCLLINHGRCVKFCAKRKIPTEAEKESVHWYPEGYGSTRKEPAPLLWCDGMDAFTYHNVVCTVHKILMRVSNGHSL